MNRSLQIVDKKILKNTVYSVLSSFIIKGINLISVPIFTRMVSTEEYGKINLFMTYATILTILISLDLGGCVFRGIIEYSDKKERFLSSLIFLSFVIFFIISYLIYIFRSPILRLLNINSFILQLLILYSYACFVINLVSSSLIVNFKYKENALVGGCSSLINVSLSILLMLTIYKNNKYMGRIFGAVLPSILLAVILCILIIKRGRHLINRVYWKFALSMSVPLIPHSLSHLIFAQSDKIMIAKFVDDSTVGIYSVVTNISLILMTVVEALNNAWNPWLFRKLKNEQIEEIRAKGKIYISLFSALIVAFMIVSPEIVKILSPKSYWKGTEVVYPIIVGVYFYFLYTFFANIEFYLKKTLIISMGTIIAAMVNIGVNLMFMSTYGYKVAAYSTLVSYLGLLFIHYIITNKLFKISIYDIKKIVLCIICTCIAALYMHLFIDKLMVRLTGGIGIVCIIYFFIRMDRKENV